MNWTIFMGEVDRSRYYVKILIWQLQEGQVGGNGQKMGQENIYTSCNYSCTFEEIFIA